MNIQIVVISSCTAVALLAALVLGRRLWSPSARYIALGIAVLLCGPLLYALLVMLTFQAYQRGLDFTIR
jgi:hypothetical protein